MRDPQLYDFDPEIIEKSQYQIPNPEKGPLERQIELTYEEALFEDANFDQEHTNYWFTEPTGVHFAAEQTAECTVLLNKQYTTQVLNIHKYFVLCCGLSLKLSM